MTDIQIAAWLSVALIFQVIAIFVAFIYVFMAPNNFHWMLKLGFASMVFGLVVQIVRSIHYLDVGSYPVDHYFPLWLSKDIGSVLLIFYFSFVHGKGATK
jgi:hypothetical protein